MTNRNSQVYGLRLRWNKDHASIYYLRPPVDLQIVPPGVGYVREHEFPPPICQSGEASTELRVHEKYREAGYGVSICHRANFTTKDETLCIGGGRPAEKCYQRQCKNSGYE